MQIKKVPFVLSFAFAGLIVVGTTVSAEEPDNDNISNKMNGNGMMNMMGAMNSPEGKEMMNACGDFMDSYESERKTE